jgi:glycosyltransferase involved in cell wall biosynthesis
MRDPAEGIGCEPRGGQLTLHRASDEINRRPAFGPRKGRPLVTFAMLSTYPPTACGLATFASALERALVAQGHRVDIVRVDDGSVGADGGRGVAGVLVNGSAQSVREAASVMSRSDVTIVQHEYGIYGGADGEEILDLVRAVDAPVMVVLHTVPVTPSPNQERVLEDLCAHASQVVVLTACARERLLARYSVDATKVVTIPHGALVAPHSGGGHSLCFQPRQQLLSWGLLGPGKGIENVIDAVGNLRAIGHEVRYTVAGMTHPKVVSRQGETYRWSLIDQARNNDVRHLVHFDQSYRSPEWLTHYIASSSLVILPYASTDQAVSGVLVDSIAAGRPVIATAFPHAVELLSDGAGIVVPHGDQAALTEAIRIATTDRSLLRSMTARARELAPMHSWTAVGRRYAEEASALVRARSSVSA